MGALSFYQSPILPSPTFYGRNSKVLNTASNSRDNAAIEILN
jgi:hypothetical protein